MVDQTWATSMSSTAATQVHSGVSRFAPCSQPNCAPTASATNAAAALPRNAPRSTAGENSHLLRWVVPKVVGPCSDEPRGLPPWCGREDHGVYPRGSSDFHPHLTSPIKGEGTKAFRATSR